MLTVYGSLMPLRILEEIVYWKTKERDAAAALQSAIPDESLRQTLFEWEPTLRQMASTANQWLEIIQRSNNDSNDYVLQQVDAIAHASIAQSTAFVRQLSNIVPSTNNIATPHEADSISPEPDAIFSDAGHPPAMYTLFIEQTIHDSNYFIDQIKTYLNHKQIQDTGPVRWEHPLHYMANYFPSHPNRRSSDTKVTSDAATNDRVTATIGSSKVIGTYHPQEMPDNELRTSVLLTNTRQPVPIGGHQLPPLPYSYNALEPYIDETTMRLHHDIHHLSYVKGLNEAELALQQAREANSFPLIKHWERELAFNGAGHYLHTIFWDVMHPDGGKKPSGAIARQIEQDFGSFESFQSQFSAAALKAEGGGWAILVWSPRSHRLQILQAEKHQNLSQWDAIPLLVLDVWEHAYYLKYQNKRNQYIAAWWNIINWQNVNERFEKASQLMWTPY